MIPGQVRANIQEVADTDEGPVVSGGYEQVTGGQQTLIDPPRRQGLPTAP
jgi:hypothetical protein